MLKKEGSTLIEVVIAVALIVLVSVPISNILLHSSNSTANAGKNMEISQAVENKMEAIKNQLKSVDLSVPTSGQTPLSKDELGAQYIAGSRWEEDSADKKYHFVCTVSKNNPYSDKTINPEAETNTVSYNGEQNKLDDSTHYIDLQNDGNATVELQVYNDSADSNGNILRDKSAGKTLLTNINFQNVNNEQTATIYFNASNITTTKHIEFTLNNLPSAQYHLYCVFVNKDDNENVYNVDVLASHTSQNQLKISSDYITNPSALNTDNNSSVSQEQKFGYSTYIYNINIKAYKVINASSEPEQIDMANCLGEINSGCLIRRKS